MPPCIVILAAGRGQRMHSSLPKVLHPLAGRPLLEHVVQTALALTSDQIPQVVTGYQHERVQKQLAHLPVKWIFQEKQLGTGHALQIALPAVPPDSRVLVLCGDVPLVSARLLQQLITTTPENAMGLVTAILPEPSGFGRIVRNSQKEITHIVEEKDANTEIRAIHEINTGIYFVPQKYLQRWLPMLSAQNTQNEYYLTDIISLALSDNIPVHTILSDIPEEIMGVNTRTDLARLERYYQKKQAEHLMKNGVTLMDPARFDVRGEIVTGSDVVMDANVICEGVVRIGSHVRIGPNCLLRNVTLGDHTDIRACSVIEDAVIAEHCVVGPFARIRPGTQLEPHSLVGNFVEIKNSHIGQGSKISHLSYIGDCRMGHKVNIGAGTITCNYDGAQKHRTDIGDHVFIGSNSALVAPLTVQNGATIGAGSVLTHDAPADQLTVARARQRTVPNWHRPEKSEKNPVTEKN